MPFPDAEHAIVTQEKLCDYLLNPAHPVGGPKAAWFATIGYTQQNWEQLRSDLLQGPWGHCTGQNTISFHTREFRL